MPKLAIVHCGQLVTSLVAHGSSLADGALLIEGDRIVQTGTLREIEPRIDAATEVIDAEGRVVMPGFVDAHTHPVFAGNRADEFEQRASGATYREIAASGGGIRSTVRKTRAASQDELTVSARRYGEWFLRNGTTTIEAKSGYGLSLETEAKLLRVIQELATQAGMPVPRYVPTFLGAHEIPDEYRGKPKQYVDHIVHEMLPFVAAERLAEFCDVFCEPGIFDLDDSRRILSAARKLGMGLRIHADQLSRSGGAELAAELRVDTADHLEYTDPAGIGLLRKAGVRPVLLPGSVYALGSRRYPDARGMLDVGLEVVLASDFNPGSSPTPSMPMILSLACTQMKMTPAEAIRAATIHAARSLRRGDQIGSLEPGKLADIVIHDRADWRELPYFFGVEPAHTVLIGGRVVFRRA